MATDNIYPDQSAGAFDIKYAQLLILGSDVRRNLGPGAGGSTGGGSTGEEGGGDPDPIPPGSGGCVKKAWGWITQTGGGDPIVTYCENTIGAIVWSRQVEGEYLGTLAGAFPDGRTWLAIQKDYFQYAGDPENRILWSDVNTVRISTRNSGGSTDDALNKTSFEIRTCCDDPDCVAIGVIEFSLPDASEDIAYEYRKSLEVDGATAPFNLVVTSKPDWMTIVVDEDTNEIVFSGTPTDPGGPDEVNFTITNCSGSGLLEVGTFITVADCIDVAITTVAFPDLLSDTTTADFEFAIPLSGSIPFALGAITAPDFFDITIEELDIIGFAIVVRLNRDLTGADESTGNTISVEVTNCISGTQTYADSFDVVAPPAFQISHTMAPRTADNYTEIQILPFTTTTAYVDWGDGTGVEPYPLTGGFSTTFFHTYKEAGTYNQVVYFLVNTSMLSYFVGFVGGADDQLITAFDHSTNLTNFTGNLVLMGVDDLATCLPPSASHIGAMEITGQPASSMTTLDLSGLVSFVKSFSLNQFPLLTTITNLPSTVTTQYSIQQNPLLTAVNSGGNMPTAQLQQMASNADGIVFGTLDLSTCNFFTFVQDFSVSQVNAFLTGLDANGISNGNCFIPQTPDAVPTGAGATAKTSLQGKGWSVTTDV